MLLWLLIAPVLATAFHFCGVTPEWEEALAAKLNSTRRLQPSSAFSRSSALGGLRIHAHYLDMSALSSDLVTRIQTVIMPSVIAWYAHTLQVYNLNQNWVLPQTTCGDYQVPAAHQTTGLEGVDLVMYVSATNDAGSSYAGRAGPCAFDGGSSPGSPIAGTFLFNAAHYTADLEVETEIGICRHEVAHILAFSNTLFARYVQPNGVRYPNPMVQASARGLTVTQLTTPEVVGRSKAAFDCASLTGLELENGGGSGTVLAHWEKRLMNNDFMTGILTTTPLYSDITLAAFADSGWYTVDYAYTDQITFGKGRGCSFFTSKCIISGVAQFPEFCDTDNSNLCDSFHTKKASCQVATYTSSLPATYQYFSDPQMGGVDQLADFCPYVVSLSNGDCTGRSKTAPFMLPEALGEKACENCRCFTGTYVKINYSLSGDPLHSGCHEVICADGVLSVKIGTTTVNCPAAGGQISSISGYTGYITCPAYADVCEAPLCLNGCFGYGKCVSGKCVCDDGYSGSDCSIVCALTCKTCSGSAATQCLTCYSHATKNISGACECDSQFTLDVPTQRCLAAFSCHPTCATCSGAGSEECTGCHSNASLPNGQVAGACACNQGFYMKVDYTCGACVPAGCLYCIGPNPAECMTSNQAAFVKRLATAYSLPSLQESSDHLICYRTPLPVCSDAITLVVGAVPNYGGGNVSLDAYQCYELLKAVWPSITHWFSQLIPGFTGPAGASESELLTIKSVIYLWILQYGPAQLKYDGAWIDLTTAFKAASSNWANYLAWMGGSPGYTLDAGASTKSFPADLQAWLANSCSGDCLVQELAVLNLKSTVCQNPSCVGMKSRCGLATPGSPCAVNGSD